MYENPATYTDPVYTDSPLCAQLFLSHRLSAHGKTPGADPAHGTHTDAMCMAVTGPRMGARANWDADTQGHTWPAQVAAQGPTGPGELGGSTHPGWACWPGPRHVGWPSARCWGLRPGCPRPGSSLGPLPPLCMAGPEGSCAWPSRGSRPALEDGPQAERGAGPRPEHRPLRCLRFVDVSVTVPGLRASCGGPSGRTRACTWPLNTEGMRDGGIVSMVPGQVQLGAS